jgi:TrmH family RNA methyltransferase
MISKGTIRYIKSLQLKKYRNKAQSFLVEGTKSVLELLNSNFEVTHLVGTDSFLKDNEIFLSKLEVSPELVSAQQLNSLSSLKTNQDVLAVARKPVDKPLSISKNEYSLALDGISDPGNLGTIIRTADWYGIQNVICSRECADFYNPKVIQASMGSFTRVRIHYTDLLGFLKDHLVYGAALEGENVHQINFANGGVLLIGNEAHGISPALHNIIDQWICIPGYGGAESLNAALATAVICDNLRRQKIRF